MLKIGDFSRLGQISVDTLRHYDALGLLKPVEVDESSGYRYYAHHQLGRLNRILALKDLGLSLEQISLMLVDDVSAEQLKGMLKFKQAEIEKHIGAEHERLARVEARLTQIEMEARIPKYDVIIKSVRPQLVASIRRSIPSYDKVGALYDELMAYLGPFDPPQWRAITVWHDAARRENEIDAEAAITLKTPVPETKTVKVYELPGVDVASTVHNGAYIQMHHAYEALNTWIKTNGYRITGGNRELYHYAQEPLRNDDESYVTEIQFPVEKI